MVVLLFCSALPLIFHSSIKIGDTTAAGAVCLGLYIMPGSRSFTGRSGEPVGKALCILCALINFIALSESEPIGEVCCVLLVREVKVPIVGTTFLPGTTEPKDAVGCKRSKL